MRIPIMLALATHLALGGAARAGEKAGVRMADTLEVRGQQLTLNGMGLREATWLKIDVYVAGLYLEHVSSDPSAITSSRQTKVLVLRFVRSVGRDDIVKAWHEGFQHNAPVPLSAIQREIDQLDAWTPRFSKGDTLSFVYVPDEGVTVFVNDVRKGTIRSESFARALFSIWFGPRPPTEALRRGLLGDH